MEQELKEWTPQHRPSRAALAFLREIDSLIDLLYFVGRVCRTYELVDAKHPNLIDSLDDPYTEGHPRLTKPVDELVEKHFERLNQMIFCRCMDAFMLYVADLVGEIFRAKPECLRSSEKVEIEEVLRHQDMNSLIEALGARKVETLSYQGAREVCGYLSQKLGLQVPAEAKHLALIVATVEKRNLVVHNRAIVNARFRERSGMDLPEGSQLSFSKVDTVYMEIVAVREFAARLDDEAAGKFGLKVGAV
jgi:hypothetical protein